MSSAEISTNPGAMSHFTALALSYSKRTSISWVRVSINFQTTLRRATCLNLTSANCLGKRLPPHATSISSNFPSAAAFTCTGMSFEAERWRKIGEGWWWKGREVWNNHRSNSSARNRFWIRERGGCFSASARSSAFCRRLRIQLELPFGLSQYIHRAGPVIKLLG
jgi:hypothetical protein